MGTNTVSILTICLLCGILHGIMYQSTTFTEKRFSKKTGILYEPPYAGPEMTSCSKRPCTAISCARACQEEAGCVVFSHNEAKAKCILSGQRDNESANYEISHSEWNTYYTECPVHTGYVLYTSHQPPLCLRLDQQHVRHEMAKSVCRQEQADLVRVKTLAIYDIVKDLLTNAGFLSQIVYIGAEETSVESQFLWNDGTPLIPGTSLWKDRREGFDPDHGCTGVSTVFRIVDIGCRKKRAFVCQYDIKMSQTSH